MTQYTMLHPVLQRAGIGVACGWLADEIAAETRLEVNHIYVLKHRGLKKLREYCAGE